MEKRYEGIMQFFSFSHLPDNLRGTFSLFEDLATDLLNELPMNPERAMALRKLLEAKDCAVRAVLYVHKD